MLDMGFIHDMKKIFALLPKERQTLLFSATFSDEIRQLAQGLLKSPQSIQVTPKNSTVQRISQVWHLVGRGKKKALLAHIIESKDWSQVLVFVRTKFGANNVAEFLSKNGISAMALHGNKSQSARTQALAGFKSGSIRALVATDIAARGIDIEELPHVVNYEIPNVPEDYVHRIGRTGRAGREGHAVNLVSLDEEGFLLEIEKFTRQEIPRQDLPEYAPEPGEKAEPIAMGRQTIWGGRGKPPGREVMAAAAKAAKQDLMQRIREKKAATPSRHGGGGHDRSNNQNKKQSNTAGNNSSGSRPSTAAQGRRPEGQGGRRSAAGAGGAGARGGARPARSGGTGGSGNSSSGGNRNAGAGNRAGRAPVQVAR
jgi:ATP-dependent RNA helicase RhlE